MVVQALYEKLREVARKPDQTISYADVAQIVGIPIKGPVFAVHVGKILDEVGRIEHAAGRPVLSAVVRGKIAKLPGKGFFKLMQELGLCLGSDDDLCWRNEMCRVNDYWARH